MRKQITLTFVVLLISMVHCVKRNAPSKKSVVSTKKATISREIVVDGSMLMMDTISSAIDSNCHISGPVINQVRDREGYITYRGDVSLYSVTYVPPYDSDSQTIGYVCNMPGKFKRVGLKVRFSGKYYHAYKYIKTYSAGETVLYLVLNSIELN